MSENKLRRLRFNGEDLFDLFYPVGYQYRMVAVAASDDPDVAFPPAERPENMWPDTTWERLWHLEGVFFRTEGDSTTADNDGRVDGLQADQMQRITGATARMTRVSSNTQLEDEGALSRVVASSASAPTSGSGASIRIAFDSAGSPDARASATTAGETRPVNRLERVYRRTA